MKKQRIHTVLGKGLLLSAGIAILAGLITAWAPRSLAGGTDAESLALEGVNWVLVSTGEVEITARFDEDKVTGSAGCNGYFAGYEVDGDSISVSAMGTTMMACPESVLELEMAFASTLASVESYVISGTTLELVCDGGSLIFAAS